MLQNSLIFDNIQENSDLCLQSFVMKNVNITEVMYGEMTGYTNLTEIDSLLKIKADNIDFSSNSLTNISIATN
jgi:hypothetical protein